MIRGGASGRICELGKRYFEGREGRGCQRDRRRSDTHASQNACCDFARYSYIYIRRWLIIIIQNGFKKI